MQSNYFFTPKNEKKCKVGAAIELSTASPVANWVQRCGGFLQVGFGHFTLRFSIFPLCFGYYTPRFSLWEQSTLPQRRFVTFSFLFAKKDKKNQLLLETKDSQPSSKIFKLEHTITQVSPLSLHVTCHIFHYHPEQTDPILFSELAEAKITFITWGEIQNWHLSMVEDYWWFQNWHLQESKKVGDQSFEIWENIYF